MLTLIKVYIFKCISLTGSYREWMSEWEHFHLLVHSSTGCNRPGQDQVKARSHRTCIQVLGLPWKDRGPSIWAILCYPPRHIGREWYWKWSSCESNWRSFGMLGWINNIQNVSQYSYFKMGRVDRKIPLQYPLSFSGTKPVTSMSRVNHNQSFRSSIHKHNLSE